MGKYRVLQDYESNLTKVGEGDEVEMTADIAEFVERDSPGTLERIDQDESESDDAAAQERGIGTAKKAAVLDDYREQIPTIDLDPEDKMREVPGEGNKRTPAAGFRAPEGEEVRVVKSAAKDRMKRGTGNADQGLVDDVFGATRTSNAANSGGLDPANLADTSAQARVTSETPAAAAADAKIVANREKVQAAQDEAAQDEADDDSDDPNADLRDFVNLPDDEDDATDTTDGTPTAPEPPKTGRKR